MKTPSFQQPDLASFNFILPRSLADQFRDKAKSQGRSRSDVIRQLIGRYVGSAESATMPRTPGEKINGSKSK